MLYRLIALLLLFAACEKPLEYSGLKVLGHRGFAAGPGENTWASIEKAIELTGATEVDIIMCKSGDFIVHHDPFILVGSDSLIVSEHSLEALKQRDSSVLSLASLLDSLVPHQQVLLSLDLKWQKTQDPELAAKSLSTLLNERPHTFFIETYSRALIKALQAEELNAQLYFIEFSDYEKAVENALKLNMQGVSCRLTASGLSPEKVRDARRKGIRTMLWTINSQEDLEQVIALQADYLQTDNIPFCLKGL